MPKFKPGDRVVIDPTTEDAQDFMGNVGTVMEVYKPDTQFEGVDVLFERVRPVKGATIPFLASEVELAATHQFVNRWRAQQ